MRGLLVNCALIYVSYTVTNVCAIVAKHTDVQHVWSSAQLSAIHHPCTVPQLVVLW